MAATEELSDPVTSDILLAPPWYTMAILAEIQKSTADMVCTFAISLPWSESQLRRE
jgi:hypothetical protein